MKKQIFLLVAVILFTGFGASLPIWANSVASIHLYPDSRFLKAEGTITLTPETKVFSLRLFPSAQVTSLWTPGLTSYLIDRNPHSIIVTIEMREHRSEVQLEIAYEGFLDESLSYESLLSRDALWYPEFSVASIAPTMVLHVPEDYIIDIGDSFSTGDGLNSYDIVWDNMKYPEFLVSTKNGENNAPGSTLGALPLIEEAYNGFLTALSNRDQDSLKVILDPQLHVSGLLEYLWKTPPIHGHFRGEIQLVSWNDFHDQCKMYASLRDEQGQFFDLFVEWVYDQQSWVIRQFSMKPQTDIGFSEDNHAFRNWLKEVHSSLIAGHEMSEIWFAPQFGDVELYQQFFKSLTGDSAWHIHSIATTLAEATIIHEHSDQTSFFIRYSVALQDDTWVITDIQIRLL